MTTTAQALSAVDVADLRARVDGQVVAPGDTAYPDAFAPFNSSVVQRPLAAVLVESVADVVQAVRWAADRGLRVAVQATGHGIGRPADDALLVVTSRLRRIHVDPERATAYVAAGNVWGDVLPLTQSFGLAPVLGSSPLVGCTGFVLGGGIGWVTRRFGLGSDNVRSFDVVTPDGSLRRASQFDEPELFDALRGAGGGPFGVVVGIELQLHPVTKVYGGNLYYAPELAGEVARRWRDWTADAPEELTSSVVFMRYPPVPDVPEPLRGREFAVVRGLWSGNPAQGRALVDQWRRWREPVLDRWSDMPFGEVGTVSHDPTDPMPAYVTNDLFDTLPDDMLDIAIEGWADDRGTPSPVVLGEIRHLGGAVRRLGGRAVNDRFRSAEYCLEYVSVAFDDGAVHEVERRYARAHERLAPYATGAAYLNFTEGPEKQDRTPLSSGTASWQRLRALKAALDPDDRFCHGMAVPPLDPPSAGAPPAPRRG